MSKFRTVNYTQLVNETSWRVDDLHNAGVHLSHKYSGLSGGELLADDRFIQDLAILALKFRDHGVAAMIVSTELEIALYADPVEVLCRWMQVDANFASRISEAVHKLAAHLVAANQGPKANKFRKGVESFSLDRWSVTAQGQQEEKDAEEFSRLHGLPVV